MPVAKRLIKSSPEVVKPKLPSPGPYIGVVTNHLDPTYMGALEVSLIIPTQGSTQLQRQTGIVHYSSPYSGTTSDKFEGNDSSKYDDVQKSYGFWGVPPDLGQRLLCIFINSDPNQGYWIGCVHDKFQNHMVPGLASTQNVEITPEQEQKYGTRFLPVAEFHKKSRKDASEKSQDINTPNKYNKPIHPFADRLLAQGLLLDTVRGPTTSGARREIPSNVFGISTPGPIDQNAPKVELGYNEEMVKIPVSRLGGSSFVMDDGDKDGQNELVRIRTRTGHQILLHNSHDLIYIANSKGTAWIEMTSNGKIDIYAKDSVSIHTETDFNFRADRDINIEAGRDINMYAGGSYQLDVVNNYTMVIQGDGRLTFAGSFDQTTEDKFSLTGSDDIHIGSQKNIYQTSLETFHIKSAKELYQTSANDLHLKTNGQLFVESDSIMHLKTGADFRLLAESSTNIKSAHHIEQADTIDMNGPSAAVADVPTPAKAADPAEIPSPLPKFYLPNRAMDAGWSGGQFYKATDIESIMKRVPTHEPWDHHENIDTTKFSPTNTSIGKASPTREDRKKAASSNAGAGRSSSEFAATDPRRVRSDPATSTIPPDTKLNRSEGSGKDMPAEWVKDLPFIKKVKEVAKSLNCSYIDLLACMAFETGRTFNPALRNSIGATGLIQFIRPTAVSLGTTTDELAAMTRVEQMVWVEKYFKKGPVAKVGNPQVEDLYMQILWPVAVGKDLDYVLFKEPTKAYEQNKGLDKEKKGYVTKKDAAGKVRDQLSYIRQQLLKVPDEGGQVVDGSGKPITDSSGNPIRYGGG
jgi:hypothetical protein